MQLFQQTSTIEQTALKCNNYMTEWQVFPMLDTLKHTATGLDGIPVWFLRLGVPLFAAPLAELLINPWQAASFQVNGNWKTTIIRPYQRCQLPLS